MPFFLNAECVKEAKSLMWVYVLVGNVIRGIGETPIMPLGLSYIEDFAKSENSPFYIGEFENLPQPLLRTVSSWKETINYLFGLGDSQSDNQGTLAWMVICESGLNVTVECRLQISHLAKSAFCY